MFVNFNVVFVVGSIQLAQIGLTGFHDVGYVVFFCLEISFQLHLKKIGLGDENRNLFGSGGFSNSLITHHNKPSGGYLKQLHPHNVVGKGVNGRFSFRRT